MLTEPKTTPIDFTVEPAQQLFGANTSRVWIQFCNPTFSQVGVDFFQQATVENCAFVVQPLTSLVLTKGDLGSVIGTPMYGTTGPPTPVVMLVTEILLK